MINAAEAIVEELRSCAKGEYATVMFDTDGIVTLCISGKSISLTLDNLHDDFRREIP